MPTATPDRVLDKFRRLHTRFSGSDRTVSFVKYTITAGDFWGEENTVTTLETTIDPPAIVRDQPGEDLLDAFNSGIAQDERLFIVVADSFVARTPTATLAQRAEDFILQRADGKKGGIKYGNTIYAIRRFFARPIIGSVPARFVILGVAQKKSET